VRTRVENGRIAAEAEPVGAHLHVRVRGGAPGSRALLGTLIMSAEDWEAFADLVGGREEPSA
jgi:hypothetical protein